MVRAEETVIIHVSRFIERRLTLTVHGKPIGMALEQLRPVHGPFPIVHLKPRLMTLLIDLLVVSLEQDTADATTFHQLKQFPVRLADLRLINSHPDPVLHLTGLQFLDREASLIVHDITNALIRQDNSHTESTGGRLYLHPSVSRQGCQLLILQEKILLRPDIILLRSVSGLLLIEHRPKQFIYVHVIRVDKRFLALTNSTAREIEETPTLRHVHIHLSGRLPNPILLRAAGLKPLYTREINPPIITSLQRVLEITGQGLSRNRHLHAPLPVRIIGTVQRPVGMYRQAQARTIPLQEEITARTVRTVQHQVENNTPGVILDLEIMMPIPIRIDEHLEVVIIINNGIPLGQSGNDILLFQDRPDIEEIVIPQHSRPGIINRLGKPLAPDIGERGSRHSLLP